METINFGCQVRCLNRQRLIPGSTHPQLNQCASRFLAKVRKEILSSSSGDPPGGSDGQWMKLKLNERGLRIIPPPVVANPVAMATVSTNTPSFFCTSTSSSASILSLTDIASGSSSAFQRKSDEGFESDSEHSFDRYNRSDSSLVGHSGGCSSGVNSSSSDLEEPESRDGIVRVTSQKRHAPTPHRDDSPSQPVRCGLSDILSCQHPPALGRHVVLLTLRSSGDSALDILALECSAEEPARILTMLCQKIASNAASAGSASSSDADSNSSKGGGPSSHGFIRSGSSTRQKNIPSSSHPAESTPAVSVQSWTEREKMLDALIDSNPKATTTTSSAQKIIRQLERQHSEWNLIQRRTEFEGLTHVSSTPIKTRHHHQQQQQQSGHNNKPATTSGGVLKKGMPSGGSMGHLTVRQETDGHHLSLSNSGGSRSGGVSVIGNGVVLLSSSSSDVHHRNHPAASGLKRSDTMHQKLIGTSKPINGHQKKGKNNNNNTSNSSSCILSLQTPELPLTTTVSVATCTAEDAPIPPSSTTKSSRWSFGTPFRSPTTPVRPLQRPMSPEVSRRGADKQQRGRSSDRKSSKIGSSASKNNPSSELAGLFISSSGIRKNGDVTVNGTVPSPPATKIKRDPSKTRSFLMKFTSSSSRKSPTPPVSPPASTLSLSNDVRPNGGGDRPRGRSLVRLRSSARSPPPPQPIQPSQQQQQQQQTFLIPTKSGQELTRHIYPKETSCRSLNASALSPPHQPVFHLLASGAGGRQPSHRYNGWPGYWPNEVPDANNNQHQPQHQQQQQNQQQQQWIYFHPHPAAAIKASNELKRIQRSRSQSPGRRNSQRLAMASLPPSSLVISPLMEMPRWLAPPHPPTHHYYALPSAMSSSSSGAAPVSLPPDVSHLVREPSRSFRRSKSSSRLSGRHLQSKSDRSGSSSNIGGSIDRLSGNGSKAVTFHAFATVQLVD